MKLLGKDAVKSIWTPDTSFLNAKKVEYHKTDLWGSDFFRIFSDGKILRQSR